MRVRYETSLVPTISELLTKLKWSTINIRPVNAQNRDTLVQIRYTYIQNQCCALTRQCIILYFFVELEGNFSDLYGWQDKRITSLYCTALHNEFPAHK